MHAAILHNNGIDYYVVVFDVGARTALVFVTLCADGEREPQCRHGPQCQRAHYEDNLIIYRWSTFLFSTLLRSSKRMPFIMGGRKSSWILLVSPEIESGQEAFTVGKDSNRTPTSVHELVVPICSLETGVLGKRIKRSLTGGHEMQSTQDK
ncbi:hypothetical protein ZEAMMB73_Zm00001d010092 [Zea mays]|uniref:Uncharacterized protein n=1 Tax=Zea mays TaxID=4577 RepID=A0A1D6FP51_MAIZE|nr:hypothetical protein ZEAMMB73_Zm00001d015066 [Zea mays]AQK93410.1 hypothetical protein ZEAMMB73_Zm00001d010092 [Zea mays]